MQPIDLRSDTVTRPTEAMRAAMASAEVGDDVYGEDPTINRLQEFAVELLGKQAALFVPTGTMGNQIAIKVHTRPGTEVVCDARSHIVDWEMATMAQFSGVLPRTVPGSLGMPTWAQVQAVLSPRLYYRAQTSLISIENTHNLAGGTVMPLAQLDEICAGAHAACLPVHMDGARIFNAAAALDVPVARIAQGCDSVMFCLSKGLGAPAGSMVVGTTEFIEQARSVRKALGGGMRQAGILAAAGLVALQQMPARLVEDHANARTIADMLAQHPAVDMDMDTVQTNIVIFHLREHAAAQVAAAARTRDVLTSAFGPRAIRLVTHCDVSAQQCERAAQVLLEILSA